VGPIGCFFCSTRTEQGEGKGEETGTATQLVFFIKSNVILTAGRGGGGGGKFRFWEPSRDCGSQIRLTRFAIALRMIGGREKRKEKKRKGDKKEQLCDIRAMPSETGNTTRSYTMQREGGEKKGKMLRAVDGSIKHNRHAPYDGLRRRESLLSGWSNLVSGERGKKAEVSHHENGGFIRTTLGEGPYVDCVSSSVRR